MASAALAQFGAGPGAGADRQLTIGTGTLVAGVALLPAGATTDSLAIFVAALALVGTGLRRTGLQLGALRA